MTSEGSPALLGGTGRGAIVGADSPGSKRATPIPRPSSCWLVANHRMSELLVRALPPPQRAPGRGEVAGATPWTRHFARWLFGDLRALVAARRWLPDVSAGSYRDGKPARSAGLTPTWRRLGTDSPVWFRHADRTYRNPPASEHPVMLAGMGGVSTAASAAVSTGGFGCLGNFPMGDEGDGGGDRGCSALTGKPFRSTCSPLLRRSCPPRSRRSSTAASVFVAGLRRSAGRGPMPRTERDRRQHVRQRSTATATVEAGCVDLVVAQGHRAEWPHRSDRHTHSRWFR